MFSSPHDPFNSQDDEPFYRSVAFPEEGAEENQHDSVISSNSFSNLTGFNNSQFRSLGPEPAEEPVSYAALSGLNQPNHRSLQSLHTCSLEPTHFEPPSPANTSGAGLWDAFESPSSVHPPPNLYHPSKTSFPGGFSGSPQQQQQEEEVAEYSQDKLSIELGQKLRVSSISNSNSNLLVGSRELVSAGAGAGLVPGGSSTGQGLLSPLEADFQAIDNSAAPPPAPPVHQLERGGWFRTVSSQPYQQVMKRVILAFSQSQRDASHPATTTANSNHNHDHCSNPPLPLLQPLQIDFKLTNAHKISGVSYHAGYSLSFQVHIFSDATQQGCLVEVQRRRGSAAHHSHVFRSLISHLSDIVAHLPPAPCLSPIASLPPSSLHHPLINPASQPACPAPLHPSLSPVYHGEAVNGGINVGGGGVGSSGSSELAGDTMRLLGRVRASTSNPNPLPTSTPPNSNPAVSNSNPTNANLNPAKRPTPAHSSSTPLTDLDRPIVLNPATRDALFAMIAEGGSADVQLEALCALTSLSATRANCCVLVQETHTQTTKETSGSASASSASVPSRAVASAGGDAGAGAGAGAGSAASASGAGAGALARVLCTALRSTNPKDWDITRCGATITANVGQQCEQWLLGPERSAVLSALLRVLEDGVTEQREQHQHRQLVAEDQLGQAEADSEAKRQSVLNNDGELLLCEAVRQSTRTLCHLVETHPSRLRSLVGRELASVLQLTLMESQDPRARTLAASGLLALTQN